MKKFVTIFLLIVMVMGLVPLSTSADEVNSFEFELSVDGSDSKTVSVGDVITVVLHLKRTDANEKYTMYAMQDEIRYDSDFFELVEGSVILSDGIESSDIGMRDQYREFYMNFLSMSGGAEWEADMLIGSFQLRVIATSGVTKITNQDYLVSTKDGLNSFPCTANELTIIASTECTVRFESNGGSLVEEQIVQYGEKVSRPEDPTREGYSFDGWYADIDKTIPWDFETDVVEGNMSLYAKWVEEIEPPIVDEPAPENCDWWWLILIIIALLIVNYWRRKQSENNKRKRSPSEENS
jgi:uncharacterized repeat protein (TIGR02543 family)